jgi:putative transposase
MKNEILVAGKIFKITQCGNGDEPLFFEHANRLYFEKLVERHLSSVCEILHFEFDLRKVELIIQFRSEAEIPEKFRTKLHLPLSNLFNSYAKSINKRYNRKGSLFRTRFERKQILSTNFYL